MNPALHNPSWSFARRTFVLGSAAFTLSVLAGVAMLFWREYGVSIARVPRQAALDLITQATIGPIYVGLMLFVITAPVLALLATLVYVGHRRRSLILSVLPFVLLGAYWLWLIKLIGDGAFD